MAIIQWPIVIVMTALIWFVYFTSKKTIINESVLHKYKKKPAIFVFWHGRSMMLSCIVFCAGVRGYAVTSNHKDGRMMAKLERCFGLKAIYGSTTDKAVNVLRRGIKALQKGDQCICMSPDGPSGPSMRLHDGALYFAKMTGAPIIPVTFSCSKPWFQNRWDRYLVAKPFSKLICDIKDPIFIDRKTSAEEFENIRKSIENMMVKQVYDLDSKYTDFKVEQDLTASEFKKQYRNSKKSK